MIEEAKELTSPDPKSLATFWKGEIDRADNANKSYRQFGENAEKVYRAEGEAGAGNPGTNPYNIFWSNVSVLMGALYSDRGSPEVRRRHKNEMGAQKDAAMVLERAIDFCVDVDDFDSNVRRAENDWLVVGAGQVRVLYDAQIEKRSEVMQDPVLDVYGQVVGVEERVEEWEEISAQLCRADFITWRNFHWENCRSWDNCNWIAYDFYKSKKDVMEEYGVKGEETDKDESGEKAIKVTEIWHKPTKTIIVIGDQFEAPLDVRPDELGLQGFFNCPKPLIMNIKTEEFGPISDYWFYKKQAEQLNKTVTRIDNLVGSLKDQGFYDAAFTELGGLKNKGDGQFIPVDGLAERLGQGGMSEVMFTKPIQNTMAVVRDLQLFANEKKEEIYEITGLSDIVRGATVASETATAQGLKSQYASVRIRDKQQIMAYFIRDIFRIMGEIIGEHFEPEVLQRMTGVEIDEEIMAILRSDVMRTFSVDIESNSTIEQDEREEQQQRLEALGVITDYVQGIFPAMQSGAVPMELGREMLLMAVRGFKHGGNLEDIIAQLGSDNPEGQVQELQNELSRMGEEMEMMQRELAKYDQLDSEKAMADIRNKDADTGLKVAETQEQQLENTANTLSLMTRGTTPHATG